jgi:hypothetical protein
VSIELKKRHQEGEGKEAHIEYALLEFSIDKGIHDIGLSIICNKRSSYLIIGGGFVVPKVLTLENIKEITNLMEQITKEIKESNE